MARPQQDGDRYDCGKLKPRIDIGPIQRTQHYGGLTVEFASSVENGRIIYHKRMRAVAECMLDLMYHNGYLGSNSDDARDRYNAGLWLRELHCLVHPTRSTSGYSDAGRGYGSSSATWVETPDFKLLSDVLMSLGRHRYAVELVCCEDAMTERARLHLADGLDRLIEIRGT